MSPCCWCALTWTTTKSTVNWCSIDKQNHHWMYHCKGYVQLPSVTRMLAEAQKRELNGEVSE